MIFSVADSSQERKPRRHTRTRFEPLASIVVLGSPTHRTLNRIEMPIRDSHFTIGRGSDNCLSVGDDSSVSRHHCIIETVGSSLILKDLDSRNGTYLNGHRIQGSVPLPVPSLVTLGKMRLAITAIASPKQEAEQVEDLTFSTPGSIVIPSSCACTERTEVFLVADMVDSTQQLIKNSNARFAAIITSMGHILERALSAEQEAFLQCTGDGFLACLGNANTAFDIGLDLMPALASRTTDPLKISIALHWGTASLTSNGDRTGQDVHAVFALEKLRNSNPTLAAELARPDAHQLLVTTGQFWQKLDDARREQTELLGTFHLKGLEEPQQVFRWVGISERMASIPSHSAS